MPARARIDGTVQFNQQEQGNAMRPPIDYDPRYEVLEDGEGDTQADLLDVLHDIADTTFRDTGQPLRSVHAKSHGLLRAEVRVLPVEPPLGEFHVGLCAARRALVSPVVNAFWNVVG
jgi:hypothetical protein